MGDNTILDKIKAAKDIKSELIHIDEWDVDIEVRSLSGRGMEAFVTGGDKVARANLIIHSCFVPGKEEKVFPDTKEVREMLMEKSHVPTDKLIKAINNLNGFTDEGRAELKKD